MSGTRSYAAKGHRLILASADFEYCHEYCCIENDKLIRIVEDFENYSFTQTIKFNAAV